MESVAPTPRMDRREGMLPVLRAVCRALGGGWTVVDPQPSDRDWQHGVDLAGPEGLGIYVNGSSGRAGEGKWAVSGHYPNTPGKFDGVDWVRAVVGHSGDIPRIAFSYAKPPEQIARDIRRRFLGEYTRIYRAAVEKRDAHVKQVAERAILADTLAKRFGLRVGGTEGEQCHWSGTEDRPGYGDLTIGYGGTVNMDLRSLPPDVAEAVLAVLFPGK